MPTENRDDNFGLEPEVADDLRTKAAALSQRLDSGDEEAERTMRQLQVLVGMAAKDVEKK